MCSSTEDIKSNHIICSILFFNCLQINRNNKTCGLFSVNNNITVFFKVELKPTMLELWINQLTNLGEHWSTGSCLCCAQSLHSHTVSRLLLATVYGDAVET